MIILTTGVSGIKIEKSLNKFLKFLKNEKLVKENFKPEFFKIDNEIEKIYYQENPQLENNKRVWVNNILQLPYYTLEKYWEKALQNIKEKIAKYEKDRLIIINITACYYHNKTQEYFSLVNVDSLEKLSPSLLVNFIDDIFDIYHRLSGEGGIFRHHDVSETGMIFNLLRLLDWRAKENMMSRFIAKQLMIKNYIFAVKHELVTFYNLIFGGYRKIYLSHPITEIRALLAENNKNKVDTFLNELDNFSNLVSKSFVAFLPTTIDEYRIKNEKSEVLFFWPHLLSRWDHQKYASTEKFLYTESGFNDENKLWKQNETLKDNLYHLQIPLRVLYDLISLQVTIRDHCLVEQSDFLILYRPFFNGRLSTGCKREFEYFLKLAEISNNLNKSFTYCPEEDINDFFIRQFVDKLKSELTNGDVLFEKSSVKFKNLTEKESQNIINAASKREKNLVIDVFEEVIDNYYIGFKIDDPVVPLGPDKIENFKSEFASELIKTYGLVDDFINKTKFLNKKLTEFELLEVITNYKEGD